MVRDGNPHCESYLTAGSKASFTGWASLRLRGCLADSFNLSEHSRDAVFLDSENQFLPGPRLTQPRGSTFIVVSS